MITAEVRTVINRPVEDVFTYLADFDNLAEYDQWVVSATHVSGPRIGLGSKWTTTRAQGRRRIETPLKVTEYQPNWRLAIWSAAKGFDVTAEQDFRSCEDGSTELVEVVRMKMSGLVRFFEPLIRRQVPKQAAAVHAKIKELLEAA